MQAEGSKNEKYEVMEENNSDIYVRRHAYRTVCLFQGSGNRKQ